MSKTTQSGRGIETLQIAEVEVEPIVMTVTSLETIFSVLWARRISKRRSLLRKSREIKTRNLMMMKTRMITKTFSLSQRRSIAPKR